jgi:hypothetical protein
MRAVQKPMPPIWIATGHPETQARAIREGHNLFVTALLQGTDKLRQMREGLAGIAARNGILKISHYINLALHEGEVFGRALVVRGSLERLTPVLMTALTAAVALSPLLVGAEEPGKEILHPVAVVIFGGLVSSTLLDTLVTPVMFLRWGRRPLERLLATQQDERF